MKHFRFSDKIETSLNLFFVIYFQGSEFSRSFFGGETKPDFNLNNIIATLSLISFSSVKKSVGKCPDTYSNLISTPLDEC